MRRVEGQLIREIYQLQLTAFEGGGPYPLVLVDGSYDWQQPGRGLVSLSISRLHTARFQIAIPASQFVLPKPKEVEVLDRRVPGAVYQLLVGEAETDDVRKLLPAKPGEGAMGPPPMSLLRRLLYIVNGLALIALGIWLWRRVSLKDPKH